MHTWKAIRLVTWRGPADWARQRKTYCRPMGGGRGVDARRRSARNSGGHNGGRRTRAIARLWMPLRSRICRGVQSAVKGNSEASTCVRQCRDQAAVSCPFLRSPRALLGNRKNQFDGEPYCWRNYAAKEIVKLNAAPFICTASSRAAALRTGGVPYSAANPASLAWCRPSRIN